MSKKSERFNINIPEQDRIGQEKIANVLGLTKSSIFIISLHWLVQQCKQTNEHGEFISDKSLKAFATDVMQSQKFKRTGIDIPVHLRDELLTIDNRTGCNVDILCSVALRWFLLNCKESKNNVFANLLPSFPEPSLDTGITNAVQTRKIPELKIPFKNVKTLLEKHQMHDALAYLTAFVHNNKSARGWNSYIFAQNSDFREKFPDAIQLLLIESQKMKDPY